MAAVQQITDELIQQSISNAVQAVSKALLRRDTPLVGRIEFGHGGADHTFELISNVGFAGEINGVVHLCMNEDYAIDTVGTILGMSEDEVKFHGNEVIRDAIGEVTNMTVGGFKNALCDIGFPCMLTLPTIIRGEKLSVATLKGSRRLTYEFKGNNRTFFADIQLKID